MHLRYSKASTTSVLFLQLVLSHVLLLSFTGVGIWKKQGGFTPSFLGGVEASSTWNTKAKTGGGGAGGGWFSKVIGSNLGHGSDDDDDDHDGMKKASAVDSGQRPQQDQQRRPHVPFTDGTMPPFMPPPPPPLYNNHEQYPWHQKERSSWISSSSENDNSNDKNNNHNNESRGNMSTDQHHMHRLGDERRDRFSSPPLPPPPQMVEKDDKRENQTNILYPSLPFSPPPPPPPPILTTKNDAATTAATNMWQYHPQGRNDAGNAVLRDYEQWQYSQYPQPQQQPQPQQPSPPRTDWMHDATQSLKYEIDQLMSHQQQLYSEIQNLTLSLFETERSNEMQQSQIDLLLEQVADAEAYASAESNAALEYKANCTALGNTVSQLQQQVEKWEQKCQELEEGNRCKDDELVRLKEKLKRKEKELENMACGIEMARLEQQKQAYQAEYDKKRNRRSKGGIFHWLFGWIYGEECSEDDSDEELEKLQEQARSTLLSALQAERDNVEELENALALEQQNNTAIAEMVASRDSLIDELNGRVAVFEEDKVVLKAALRQLQKEMKEEAPKTQKLVSELKAANAQIKKLEADMDVIKKNHTAELTLLDQKLQDKQKEINETDSKMSMISVYVDQLEERLASFAVARRDITIREKECDKLVNRSKTLEEELNSIKVEAEAMKSEQQEMKNLIDLMVQERAELQEEKRTLSTEKEKLLFESKALREELDMLNDNFLRLENDAEATQQQLEQARSIIKSQEEALDTFEIQMASQREELMQQSENITDQLQQDIHKLEEENRSAVETIRMLENRLEELEITLDEAKQKVHMLSRYHQPPPPPSTPPPLSVPMDDLYTTYTKAEVYPDLETISEERTYGSFQQHDDADTHRAHDDSLPEVKEEDDEEKGESLLELEEVEEEKGDSLLQGEEVEEEKGDSLLQGEEVEEEKGDSLLEGEEEGEEKGDSLLQGEEEEKVDSSLKEDEEEKGHELKFNADMIEVGQIAKESALDPSKTHSMMFESDGLHEDSYDDEEQLLSQLQENILKDQLEPELPHDNDDNISSEIHTSNLDATSPLQKRWVPFRTFRKRVSKVTGIHGFFSTPSRRSRS